MINSMIQLQSGSKRPPPDGAPEQQQLQAGVAAGVAPNKRLMMGLSRRLNTVLDERQRSTDSVLSDQVSTAPPSPLSGVSEGGAGLTNGSGSGVDAAPDNHAPGSS